MHVPTMAEMMAKGESPEVLFFGRRHFRDVGSTPIQQAHAARVSGRHHELRFVYGD